MANTAYPVNPQLTALAMAWRNPAVSLIADEVLPRVATAKKFSYTEYDQAQGFTVPNTQVGRKSEPTQVSFAGKRSPTRCWITAWTTSCPTTRLRRTTPCPSRQLAAP